MYRASFTLLTSNDSVNKYASFLASFVQLILNVAREHNMDQSVWEEGGHEPFDAANGLSGLGDDENEFCEYMSEVVSDFPDDEEEVANMEDDEDEDEAKGEEYGDEVEGEDEDPTKNEFRPFPIGLTPSLKVAADELQSVLQEGQDRTRVIQAFHRVFLAMTTTQPSSAERDRFQTPTEAFLIAANVSVDGSIRRTVSMTPGFSMVQYGQLFSILKEALDRPGSISE